MRSLGRDSRWGGVDLHALPGAGQPMGPAAGSALLAGKSPEQWSPQGFSMLMR